MTRTFIILFFALWGSMQHLHAQAVVTQKSVSGKAKNLYERSHEYARNNKYDRALSDINKVLKIEPNFIDAHIHLGALHYDRGNYVEAEQAFESAIALQSDYKANVWYMLGITEAKLEKYTEATQHLQAYLDTGDGSQRQRQKATQHIKRYEFVGKAKANPVPFEPKRLGDAINSQWPEYLPALTADGETLIFTRRVRGQEDFYMSTRKNGQWTPSQPLSDINDPIDNEGAQSISADGRFLAFTACNRRDGYGQCDIYYSQVKNGRWTKTKNIGTPINSRAWDSQPSLSADGKTIYFSSNRGGSLGGNDIWVSTQTLDGSWSKPINLGTAINTEGDEQAPFIHPDGQTLYFMSNGHPGMGKTDLFVARKQADGSWGEPTNLGYPINTESHEGAMIVSLDGKTAYFASDRNFEDQDRYEHTNKVAQTDLYFFELYPEVRPQATTYVKARVTDATTGEKLQARVEVEDLQKQQLHTTSQTDSDGTFLVCLPMGKNYGLNVSKKGYLFHSENFALVKTSSLKKPYILDIRLQKIPDSSPSTATNTPAPPASHQPIILKNIFFETASAALLPESLSELHKLRQLLEKHPEMRIQIHGHTDNVGSDSDNVQLSENRAKAVYTWLVKHQIDAQRLSYKGFGESQPIDTNDTEIGRQNNRRTEFVVL